MIKELLFFFASPMIEYIIHKSLHEYKNTFHREHHILISNRNNDRELWILYFLLPSIYFENYYLVIGLTRYYIAHYLIHFYPHLVKGLTKHHLEHHKNCSTNFAVSATYPDYLFSYIYTLLQ